MNSLSWQPTATLATLRFRAAFLQKMRAFFADREVLEVETPLLARAAVTDPHLHSFITDFNQPGGERACPLYLQTSPEFAMKRLLAAGIGAIYQITKAFRNEESGRLHNPEFTLLEWYRPGFDHHQLMDEMDAFLHVMLATPAALRWSYQALFMEYLQLNPHQVSMSEIKVCAHRHQVHMHSALLSQTDGLQLLMSQVIEPQLGHDAPVFVYDFPAPQAALARIREGAYPVGERFEVYIQGLEIANGYHELADAKEQQQRFMADLKQREALGYASVPYDERLIAALAHGLPDCSGVALGVDRLLLLATQQACLADVMAFSIERV